MAESKEDVNVRVRTAGREGNMTEVERLIKLGASIDVALIGASDLVPPEAKITKMQYWCVLQGACVLWMLDHPVPRVYGEKRQLPDRRS